VGEWVGGLVAWIRGAEKVIGLGEGLGRFSFREAALTEVASELEAGEGGGEEV